MNALTIASHNQSEILEYREVEHHSELPNEVTEGIASCVESAFGGGVTAADAFDHMKGDQLLVARDQQQKVLGFAATIIASSGELLETGDTGAYFAAAAISRDHQGDGLYGALTEMRVRYALLEQDANLIYTRTQHPRVQEGITSTLERVGELEGFVVSSMERVLLPAFYGHMLTAEKPAAREVEFAELDYTKGDAFLISWRIKS